ncbi:hypothetical protein imdm_1443 [gamma proteobacterium IMCC2047]|nr:hypothetical protein imdm_1443 [gamma proteobacterium IMCC2047]
MSEGMVMLLLILFIFFVALPLFVIPQIRRENKWDEEKMIDADKDKKARGEDKITRDF